MANFKPNFDWKKLRRSMASTDLGVDLGTCSVQIYAQNQGVVLKEPAVVAMDKNTEKIIEVGDKARTMLGRTPGNVVAMCPLRDGVISDHEMTVAMLKNQFARSTEAKVFTPKPRVIISVPSCVTEVEERNVINAAIDAGARRVYLIEEPLAAALGANLDLSGTKGHMVVDIGGGTTNIAVLTMNAVASSSSLKLAGNHFDEKIIAYVRRVFALDIGQTTAESIKIRLGRAWPGTEEELMLIKGRDIHTGMPRQVEISSEDVSKALLPSLRKIAEEIKKVLEHTSPELVGDITDQGIVITGGSAELFGIDRFLSEYTGITCTVADDPASCTAIGCGKSLSWIREFKEGPIKIARKRAMQN